MCSSEDNNIDLILSEDRLTDSEYINNKLLEVKLSVLFHLSKKNNDKFKELIVEFAYDLLCLERGMTIDKINSLLRDYNLTYEDFSDKEKNKYMNILKKYLELSKIDPLKAEEYSEKSDVYLSLQQDKINNLSKSSTNSKKSTSVKDKKSSTDSKKLSSAKVKKSSTDSKKSTSVKDKKSSTDSKKLSTDKKSKKIVKKKKIKIKKNTNTDGSNDEDSSMYQSLKHLIN